MSLPIVVVPPDESARGRRPVPPLERAWARAAHATLLALLPDPYFRIGEPTRQGGRLTSVLPDVRVQLTPAQQAAVRARGVIVGGVLLDAILSRPLPSEVVGGALARAQGRGRRPRPIVLPGKDAVLDPILSPLIDGIREPIGAYVRETKRKVLLSLCGAAAAGATGGYLVGRGRRKP